MARPGPYNYSADKRGDSSGQNSQIKQIGAVPGAGIDGHDFPNLSLTRGPHELASCMLLQVCPGQLDLRVLHQFAACPDGDAFETTTTCDIFCQSLEPGFQQRPPPLPPCPHPPLSARPHPRHDFIADWNESHLTK
ncbi:hypothetical protein ElyMa_007012900 [Elysia marginata]|uniref:Uncharacterized protein n=1 Tax=Elysia marginata TaxID=1093978 RepID=A0AAV4JW93_9GAST|nr:hypothetical protein ElyMa_007012900 [Elysia marginata]